MRDRVSNCRPKVLTYRRETWLITDINEFGSMIGKAVEDVSWGTFIQAVSIP